MGRGFSKESKYLESPCLHVATETLISYRLWTGHPLGLNPNYFYQKKKITFQFYHFSHPMIQTSINLHIYLDGIGLTSIMINCYPKFQLFPSPPMVAYQGYRNLKEEFVHSKFWKLYHQHITCWENTFLGLFMEFFGEISRRISFAIYYIYIYIYIYSNTLTKRINTTSTMEYFEPLSIKRFLTYIYIFNMFMLYS